MTTRFFRRALLCLTLAPAAALTVGCGGPTLDVSSPLAVVHIAPSHGAIDVDPDTSPVVSFSAPIRPITTADPEFILQRHDGTTFVTVPVKISRGLDGDNSVVRITPNDALPENTRHRVRILPTVLSEAGAQLGGTVISEFETGDAR